MLYVLTGLFCLFFTATSYCNSFWPAFITSNLIFPGLEISSWSFWALTFLLCCIFIPLEAYLYHRFLKGISDIQALRYAITASMTTLLVTLFPPLSFILLGLFQYILDLLVQYNIINNPVKSAIFILFVTFNTLIEFAIMKLVTDYPSKKLIIPVLSGYALTIALLILAQLLVTEVI